MLVMLNVFSARPRGLAVVCLLFSLFLPLTRPAQAQQGSEASIAGTVVDSHGSAIARATIVAKSEASGAQSQATADNVGRFSISGLAPGRYTLTVTAKGFAATVQSGVVASGQPATVTIGLKVGGVQENVEVRAIAGDSIAGQHALSQDTLDTETPRSEIGSEFIREFTPPDADYTELIQIAPGTVSYNSNGVGLGQGTVYFRGFPDGNFDYTWDGIPFNDTNNPTHHSWVFFPGVWIGGIDFDRSPGTASTIGPATYGGSINLLSPEVPTEQSIQPEVTYGSFNTLLLDGQYNSGMLGPKKNVGFGLDVHRLSSDGFETGNDIYQNAGDIKVLWRPSDSTTVTGYSGVIHLFSNAPNNAPYRAQVDTYGWNYMLETNDPTSAFYKAYNTNTIPTDFEYIGVRSSLGHNWYLDVKPYTYSYYNHQYYANDTGNDTTGLATGPNGSSGYITPANCSTVADGGTITPPTTPGAPTAPYSNLPCAIDKLNSYRKYGETSTISQTSRFGVFRTGVWYEWSSTNRYQIPSDPLTHYDQPIPNFHENYWINSLNPFVEFEWHATQKLSVTAGYKYAYYNFSLKQFADDGHIVGALPNNAPYVTTDRGFGASLPSVSANYRLRTNWSVYGDFGKGDEIPPSSLFDVAGGGPEVGAVGSPMMTSAYEAGTVVKLSRVTMDADYYAVKFQNNYVAYTTANPTNPTYNLNEYYLGPDSITQGFEAEANTSLTHGVNLYANGTVGKATYTGDGVPSGLNVSDTPAYTQGLALTYQNRGYDLGIIEKRIGAYYDGNGSYFNQVYIAPYNNVNLFLNYTIRRNSFFDQSKIGFGIDNLFNTESITDVAPFNSPTPINGSSYFATTAPSPLDQVFLNSGRAFTVTFKMGMFPGRGEH
jgi:iron complex outermembrane recepter protein